MVATWSICTIYRTRQLEALFEYFSMPYQMTLSFRLSFLIRALVQKAKILLLRRELRVITPLVARFRF